MLWIWSRNGERNLVAGSLEKVSGVADRVDTSTAPDIEWPTNPVRENHWDYAAARLKQERAAVGCYFSLKRKTLLQYLEPWF